MKGRSKRQVAKVARKLEKASKAHAQQAKTLKKVAKMKVGGRAVLGTLSPLYGATTGQGVFGEVGQFGLAGQLGKAYRRRKGKEEEAMQNPRNVQVDEKGRPIANPAPRAAQLAPAKRLQQGGELSVGKAIAGNFSTAGLKERAGTFGDMGKGFADALGGAMRGAAGDLSGVKQNPRNQQVDEKGNPVNNPAPRLERLAPAKPLRGGGVTKTERKKPNPKMAGDIAKREKGFAQPKVEATATSRRDRRALDGLAQRGMTKGIMK